MKKSDVSKSPKIALNSDFERKCKERMSERANSQPWMEVSFVLLEGEEERTTDQVIASMANLIRTDSFELEFLPFRSKFVNLQASYTQKKFFYI